MYGAIGTCGGSRDGSSCAAAYATGQRDVVAGGKWLTERIAGWVYTWAEYLAGEDPEETARLLRAHEFTGRPLGNKRFVTTVGALLGRNLLHKKAGRKPKDAK